MKQERIEARNRLLELVRFAFREEPWKERAKCRSEGRPDKFFPKRGQSTKPAKALCERCPVQQPCHEYARRTGSVGIWAGNTFGPQGA